MATKPKAKAKSGKGGARKGAGRKPKAVTQLREEIAQAHRPEPGIIPLRDQAGKTNAEYALDLFIENMRDAGKSIDFRLDCAREVLNRTVGKPRVAEPAKPPEEDTEQVLIYMPDNGRGSATG